jgi:hypothetical protein
MTKLIFLIAMRAGIKMEHRRVRFVQQGRMTTTAMTLRGAKDVMQEGSHLQDPHHAFCAGLALKMGTEIQVHLVHHLKKLTSPRYEKGLMKTS